MQPLENPSSSSLADLFDADSKSTGCQGYVPGRSRHSEVFSARRVIHGQGKCVLFLRIQKQLRKIKLSLLFLFWRKAFQQSFHPAQGASWTSQNDFAMRAEDHKTFQLGGSNLFLYAGTGG